MPFIVSQCKQKRGTPNDHLAVTFQIVLNSMHKYQPRVLLSRKSHSGGSDHLQSSASSPSAISGSGSNAEQKTTSKADEEWQTAFVFPETVFIAVTAYQNQLVSDVRSYIWSAVLFRLLDWFSICFCSYKSSQVIKCPIDWFVGFG